MLRRLFRFLRKQTFLVEHRLVNTNSAVLVAGFRLTGRLFHLAVEGAFALLHFRVEQLFHVDNFELAICILDFADRRPIGTCQYCDRQFRVADKFVSVGDLRVCQFHGNALAGVKRQRA